MFEEGMEDNTFSIFVHTQGIPTKQPFTSPLALPSSLQFNISINQERTFPSQIHVNLFSFNRHSICIFKSFIFLFSCNKIPSLILMSL